MDHSLTKKSEEKIQIFISMMENNRQRLFKMIEGIDDEQLDFTPSSDVESVATLLDHIAAVEWSWIFEDIQGLEMDYERWKYAFPLREWSKVTQRRGMGKEYYIEQLNSTREQVKDYLDKMGDDKLDEYIAVDNNRYTVEWILYHLINHEALHIGQISILKRLMKINNDG